MGGLCQATVDTTPGFSNVLSGTQIPEWVSKSGQELFGQASALATQPYQQYAEPRIAGFNADEQAGFAQTRATQGAYAPFLNQAGQQWDQAAADQYMNPFQQSVINRSADEMERRFDFQRKSDDAAAVGAGAFGGTRHGILNAENERNRNLALQDLFLEGNQQAYNNAQTMFNADQSRQLQVAGQSSALGYGDAAALANIGQAQRGLTQASLDTAYADFIEQREDPFQKTNFALGVLQGTPYETQNFQQGTSVTPRLGTSPFGQVAGALTGLVGANRLFGEP